MLASLLGKLNLLGCFTKSNKMSWKIMLITKEELSKIRTHI